MEKVVGSIWPDTRLKRFLYILQAGDYQVMLSAPGEVGTESASWILAGDHWVCNNDDTPVPDNTLFSYEADRVYELSTGGLV